MTTKACKITKEKTGLADRHEMKDEDIRDTMLQDENMMKIKNI